MVKLSCSPWSDDMDSSDGNVMVTQRAIPVSMVERLGGLGFSRAPADDAGDIESSFRVYGGEVGWFGFLWSTR